MYNNKVSKKLNFGEDDSKSSPENPSEMEKGRQVVAALSVEDLKTLLSRIRNQCPILDSKKVHSRAHIIKWSEDVAFSNLDGEACRLAWEYLQEKRRKHRNMWELVTEVEEMVNSNYKEFQKDLLQAEPNYPKRPKGAAGPLALYVTKRYDTYCKSGQKPEANFDYMKWYSATVKDFNALPEQERDKWRKECEDLVTDYQAKLKEFYEDHTGEVYVEPKKAKRPAAKKPAVPSPTKQIGKDGGGPMMAKKKPQPAPSKMKPQPAPPRMKPQPVPSKTKRKSSPSKPNMNHIAVETTTTKIMTMDESEPVKKKKKKKHHLETEDDYDGGEMAAVSEFQTQVEYEEPSPSKKKKKKKKHHSEYDEEGEMTAVTEHQNKDVYEEETEPKKSKKKKKKHHSEYDEEEHMSAVSKFQTQVEYEEPSPSKKKKKKKKHHSEYDEEGEMTAVSELQNEVERDEETSSKKKKKKKSHQ